MCGLLTYRQPVIEQEPGLQPMEQSMQVKGATGEMRCPVSEQSATASQLTCKFPHVIMPCVAVIAFAKALLVVWGWYTSRAKTETVNTAPCW